MMTHIKEILGNLCYRMGNLLPWVRRHRNKEMAERIVLIEREMKEAINQGLWKAHLHDIGKYPGVPKPRPWPDPPEQDDYSSIEERLGRRREE